MPNTISEEVEQFFSRELLLLRIDFQAYSLGELLQRRELQSHVNDRFVIRFDRVLERETLVRLAARVPLSRYTRRHIE